jgi:TRAP transporter 4TM/12TM fusion protein
MRIPYYSEIQAIDKIVAVLLVGFALESGRRTLGLTITVLAGVFIAYGFLGPYMPSMLAHSGMDMNKFVDQMYLTTEGLFSSLMGLSAALLFAFVAFGTFLQGTNADRYYMDIALGIAGKKPGGPAKVAILSSAAMGTISGSTIANVVTTGTLTIPLMKKTGYTPEEAGAIETTASAAGQIMPPIMGTGAFLMAEALSMKYTEIVKASIIPAIIFYLFIWFFVDIKARKRGIQGLKNSEIPKLSESVKTGLPLFIPIFVLVGMLVNSFTPFFAGTVCCVLIYVMAMINKETRISFKKLIMTIEQCAVNMTAITGIIACATIIVGIINMTGLMIKTTSIILHVSHGLLIPTIILEAVIAYVLGMGLPIATSYIILSTLGAPALIQLGIAPIAAHMMIFWFSQLATITPPVCMTAFAAAGIAEADPMKTGFNALRLGSAFYFVPILFLFSNLLTGTATQMISVGVTAIIASYFLVVSIEGYFFGALEIKKRIMSIVTCIALYISTFNAFGVAMKMGLVAASIAMIAALYYMQRHKQATNEIEMKLAE